MAPSTPPGGEVLGLRIRVDGVVQGVGFRPFVHGLASALGLTGLVGNDTTGVFIEVEGSPQVLDRFVSRLRSEAPPLAVIDAVEMVPLAPAGRREFSIVASEAGGERQTLISPDTATCDDCLRELLDPSDRRFGYAFINCTNCGPRFTIIRDVPYDRPLTSMAGFAMCAECEREYRDPADRRFHAQPVCCPACGPSLRLTGAHGETTGGDPLAGTVELLRSGRVVAIKGLGGYHLAALAASEPAVLALRSRKHREDKPFALMATDLEAARALAEVGSREARALLSPRRPIVLLRRRAGARVAPSVAPGNRSLGVMLPYSPLHHLLARRLGEPFVLTSGNVSDEPIAYLDEEAFHRLAPIADAFLSHDRPIHIRTDDSVIRVMAGRESPLRRSRGFVPQPITVVPAFRRPLLACGAELKSTFCLGKERRAFLSHHIGDLENYQTLRSYTEGIEHFMRLFDVRPELVAHDLHPEYLSTKHALEMDVERVAVQHHHAHVAACLADNGEPGPAIGVAFDGLGFGLDGSMWGGEILVCDLAAFERVGWLAEVSMPGGAMAIREPWRMAAAHLDAALGAEVPEALAVVRDHQDRWAAILGLARSGISSPRTSSAGRLFDAVAAILGVRDRINYEGQAAVELEQLADPDEASAYPAAVDEGRTLLLDGHVLVRAVVADLRRGVSPPVIAARFHNGLAALVVEACRLVRQRIGIGVVALSGGVFQNVLLTERVLAGLTGQGFRVLTHSRVPANDGGISLGQAVIAGARDAAGLV
ncbi:MAG TPA: carbamoyltransferase HypF [Candidatus Binatia bacterium]|nr:carbamoyltransferase HypF [Candidatus Binatia bacterium]